MMTDDREINELFEEMMYGSSETLSSIVYGYGRIGTGGQQVVRGMIERLREPGRMERLQIRERRTAGHFEMVIVYAPWKPHWSAEGFLPFIIGRHDSRLQLLGYVLPFNPVIPILTAEDREHAFSLAKYWVAWIQSYKGGSPFRSRNNWWWSFSMWNTRFTRRSGLENSANILITSAGIS